MTDEVAVQSAYAAFLSPDLAVSGQSAYVAILVGTRAAITSQSAYVALIDPGAGGGGGGSGRRPGVDMRCMEPWNRVRMP